MTGSVSPASLCALSRAHSRSQVITVQWHVGERVRDLKRRTFAEGTLGARPDEQIWLVTNAMGYWYEMEDDDRMKIDGPYRTREICSRLMLDTF